MKLNENLRLVLHDVYLYDIEACHFTILTKMGYELSGIDKDNKLERNIKIGQIMRDNPRITSLLRTTTESVINDYITKNNITEDDIVIRQYDGLILTKRLYYTNIKHIPLNIRKFFQVFIMSIDRTMYIALDGNFEVTIKGIPHRYSSIDELYKELCLIVFIGKRTPIFKRLQKLKDDIFNSTDKRLFKIPVNNNKYKIFLKGYGEIEVSDSTIKIMDIDDIDKEQYYKLYLEPFVKSIVFEFVR